ncbi:caspase family protein [Trichothermofontia sp.]
MKRRTFLQQTGGVLAATAISETVLTMLTDRYQRALALGSDSPWGTLRERAGSRKLALLIGINAYPAKALDPTATADLGLQGCLTDVDLQRELLIHRFGFQPADIVTLTDQQATRAGIETAFKEHLIQQAQAGDVVLIHFSGYGSLVNWSGAKLTPQFSLVPIDGVLTPTDPPVINDLVEETLYLLLRSLRTDQVTTVLDTSYYTLLDFAETAVTAAELPILGVGTALASNLRVRSRLNPVTGRLSPAALEFQTTLRQRVGEVKLKGQTALWQRFPGTLLAATSLPSPTPNLPAIGGNAFEVDWPGFSSGLLTTSLVYQLWHLLPATTIYTCFAATRQTLQQVAGVTQSPQLAQSAQGSGGTRSFPYSLPPTAQAIRMGRPYANADAVVVAVDADGKTGQVQLAGLPPLVIPYYGPHSQFTLTDAASAQRVSVELQSRNGLLARVRLLSTDGGAAGSTITPSGDLAGAGVKDHSSTLAVGQLLQESIRVLPRQINLVIGLDSTLERIERVDATSAFSSLTTVATVLADQPADYLFGRVSALSPTLIASLLPKRQAAPPADQTKTQVDTVPAIEALFDQASYGLMSIGRQVIPNTMVRGEEAVKVAVQRLIPQFKTLLAAKYLRLTNNVTSSQLGLRLTIAQANPDRLIYQQYTERVPLPTDAPPVAGVTDTVNALPTDASGGTIPLGSQVRYQLYNYSTDPIYYLLLGLDTNGHAIALAGNLQSQPTAQGKRPQLQDQVIPPGAVITLPAIDGPSPWVVTGSPGQMELFLVASRAPFSQAMLALGKGMATIANGQRLVLLENPLAVAQAVLQDLQQAAVNTHQRLTPGNDTYSLDVRTWATFNVVYQVI